MRSLALLVIVPRATARRTLTNSRSAQREASASDVRRCPGGVVGALPLEQRAAEVAARGTEPRTSGEPAWTCSHGDEQREDAGGTGPAPVPQKGCGRSAAGLVPGVRLPPRRAAAPASNGRRCLAPIQLPSCFARRLFRKPWTRCDVGRFGRSAGCGTPRTGIRSCRGGRCQRVRGRPVRAPCPVIPVLVTVRVARASISCGWR
jgi:hypothetical protein